jgi:hypothetical protein
MRTSLPCILLAAALQAQAEPQPEPAQPFFYTCTNDEGVRIRSERPIAECRDREQRQHNPDGSIRGIIPPQLTEEERKAREEVRKARRFLEERDREALWYLEKRTDVPPPRPPVRRLGIDSGIVKQPPDDRVLRGLRRKYDPTEAP